MTTGEDETTSRQALIFAAQDNDDQEVRALLQHWGPFFLHESDTQTGRTAVHWAAQSGAREALEAMAEADPGLPIQTEMFKTVFNFATREGDTPFSLACQNGRLECAEYLLSQGD